VLTEELCVCKLFMYICVLCIIENVMLMYDHMLFLLGLNLWQHMASF